MKKRMTLTALCLFLFFGIQSYAATPQEVVAVGKAVGIDVQCSGQRTPLQRKADCTGEI